MKKPLMLLLAWLACHSILAQNNTTNSQENSSPITTTGISLPQLITTNINRSNLQFGVNLSDGLERPNLSVDYKKIISDDSKQLTITGGAHMNQTFSFSGNDDSNLYTITNMATHLGADLKLFNKKNYFIEFGIQNRIGKAGGISDFNYINTSNSLTLAIGKGRIDFVNDGAAALAVTEKLSKYRMLNRDLTEDEYSALVQKINELKNRRKYVNRSYPLTETEEIQDLLLSFGVIDAKQDITPIIDDAYRFEPMIDRTTGSQFRIGVTGTYFHSDSFINSNTKGVSSTLSYMLHDAINSKWQYNKGISGYVVATETNFNDLSFTDYWLKKVGIGISNDLHYLLDNRIRMSFLSTAGYNLIHEVNTYNQIDDPFYDNPGFFLSTKAEVEFQISRTMSTTFGVNLNFTPDDTFTGLNFELNF